MKRTISTSGLFFASISAVVGSGWLFGALYAAQLAGPASLLSWVLAGGCVLILAVVFAELATMYPVSGGLVSYVYFSHGNVTGFLLSWITWLSFVILTPIEVQAALQYGSVYLPWISEKESHGIALTPWGYVLAAVLMVLILYINSVGVKIMSRANKYVTYWKIIIPTLVGIVFLMHSSHRENLGTTWDEFAPYGFTGIFSALAAGGVVFAFNGFQHAIMLSAETKNPQRSIPRAIAFSIIAVLMLYLILQISFLLVLPPEFLTNGWSHVSFAGDSGPLVGIATLLGLGWLVFLLYFDAVLSPAGAAIVYCASSSRIVYAMGSYGYMPRFFQSLNKQGVPFRAMILNFFVGMLFFFPFSGWRAMVAFLSSAILLTYALAPISLAALRRQQPDAKRTFKVPYATFVSCFAFYVANMMLFWTGWENISKLIVAIIIGFIIFIMSSLTNEKHISKGDFRAGLWLIPYVLGLGILSRLGVYGGGKGILTFGQDFLLMFLLSVGVFFISRKFCLPPEESLRNTEETLRVYTHSSTEKVN